MEPELTQKTEEIAKKPGRPVLLSVLCLIAIIFFALLTIIFFAGVLYTDWIAAVSNQYMPENLYTGANVRLFFIGGFLVHLAAVIGSVLIWKLKRTGYYFLGISCLVIASYQLFQPQLSVISTFIYLFFLFGFGLFYRRFH